MIKYLLWLLLASSVLLSACQVAPVKSSTKKVENPGFGSSDFEIGVKAAKLGDFKTAFRYWQPIAQLGNTKARHNIGYLYEKGLGVEQNYAEAVNWYRLAAEQDYMESQNNLGTMYEKGHGVVRNYTEALKWYTLAAKQNFDIAKYNLGNMYEFGRGVSKDNQETIKWYQSAAEQGNAKALSGLGYLYQNGIGVNKDNQKAAGYYEQAGNNGESDAHYNLGLMLLDENNSNKGIKWLKTSADNGNINAQYYLGEVYASGRYVYQDYVEAEHYYRMAAENHSTPAQFRLGLMYLNGEGVHKDQAEAEKWLNYAVQRGYPGSQQALNNITKPTDEDLMPGITWSYTLSYSSYAFKQALFAALANNPNKPSAGLIDFVGQLNPHENVFEFTRITTSGNRAADEAIDSVLPSIKIPPNSEVEQNDYAAGYLFIDFGNP